MATSTTSAGRVRLSLQDRPAVLDGGRRPFLLTAALGGAAALAAGLTLAFPSVLRGEPVLQGNLRGTAAVVLVAVVLLAVSAVRTAHGSARWLLTWLGTVGYLLYQAVMFCFATPLNHLFLLYVAYLSTAVWAAVSLVAAVDAHGFGARVDARMPVHGLAVAGTAFAGLTALAWLSSALPASFSADPGTVLDGSGLTTNPVWVQDLAFWLPATFAAAVWTWRHRARGVVLLGGLLTFYVLECVGIAVDQWAGARVDPGTAWASLTAVPVFLAAAAVVALATVPLYRNVDRR